MQAKNELSGSRENVLKGIAGSTMDKKTRELLVSQVDSLPEGMDSVQVSVSRVQDENRSEFKISISASASAAKPEAPKVRKPRGAGKATPPAQPQSDSAAPIAEQVKV